MNNFNIVQRFDAEGNHRGLYYTERTDVENFQSDFDAAFSNREVDDVEENADDWLETHKQIYRIYAEGVIIDF
jgi:DNA-binding transcriptional regulator GbsR (MarR family)